MVSPRQEMIMGSTNGETIHSPTTYWLGKSDAGSPAPPEDNANSLKRSIDHVESPELQPSDKSDSRDIFVDQLDFDTFYQYAPTVSPLRLRDFHKTGLSC